MSRDDATKQPFDLCSRPSESALRPPISNERARRPERERARWTRSEARDEGARRITTLRRAEVEKPQSGGCCQTALSPPCALGRPQLSRLLVKGLPTGGGAARCRLRQLFYQQAAARRPPFGQPHTRQFHFAPARTRPPPAPSGWPSNQGRAVVSGTRRIGRCRLCGGARAGFGGGGVGGRRLPNLRRGRVWSI